MQSTLFLCHQALHTETPHWKATLEQTRPMWGGPQLIFMPSPQTGRGAPWAHEPHLTQSQGIRETHCEKQESRCHTLAPPPEHPQMWISMLSKFTVTHSETNLKWEVEKRGLGNGEPQLQLPTFSNPPPSSRSCSNNYCVCGLAQTKPSLSIF